MLTKLSAVKKFVALKLKKTTISDQADHDRQDAEVARLEVVERSLPEPELLLGSSPPGRPMPRRRDVDVGAHGATSARLGDARDLRRHARGDRLDDLLLGRLVALVDADVAAEAQDGDPVGDLEDVVQVVRDEHDREAPVGEALDEVEHLARLGDAERRGRLVEDDEPRVPQHGLRDRDRLALAAGERGYGLADGADRGDGERLQRLGRALLHLGSFRRQSRSCVLAAEVHVLDDVEVVAEREVLVDDLDPELRGVLRAVDASPACRRRDLAAVAAVDAGDALDQRRLAGAVVADERHHLAGSHLEVDVGERLDRAEASSTCRGSRAGVCRSWWSRLSYPEDARRAPAGGRPPSLGPASR